ncbi:MAG: hypothetical protein FJ405_01215 [Verrucomicrobia bacterium]|nr:hypothetical protein [Verrucomicrobiota bacterium]
MIHFRPFHQLLSLILALVPTLAFSAAVPNGITVFPSVLERGKTQEIVVHGGGGQGPYELWTSFAGTFKQRQDGDGVRFDVNLPADVELGVGAVQLSSSNFLSALRLVFVDELPVKVIHPAPHQSNNAAMVSLPITIAGRATAKESDFFKMQLKSNEVVSVDLLARRLASRFDPYIRIWNPMGEEVAYNDFDRSFGADCRISFQAPEDGTYVVEVRDMRHGGGSENNYVLRLGSFFMADTAFPLAIARSGSNRVTAASSLQQETLELPPFTPSAHREKHRMIVRRPGVPGFSEIPLRVNDLPVVLDVETNHPAVLAQKVAFPCAIDGRFDRRGDVDWYRIEVEKGQKLTFRTFSRSLGSPTDVVLRLVRTNGTQIKELDLNRSMEPSLDHVFEEAGSCFLRVWEGTWLAGRENVYRLEIEPFKPRLLAHSPSDHFMSEPGADIKINLTLDRAGYDGAVMVFLDPPVEGLKVAQAKIDAGKKEGEITLSLADKALLGRPVRFQLAVKAAEGSDAVSGWVTTQNAPALKWLKERRMPSHLNGLITGLFR